ncbi:MAG: hypothetical protein WCX23_00500 [Candidatus Paceibacterota bacterium]
MKKYFHFEDKIKRMNFKTKAFVFFAVAAILTAGFYLVQEGVIKAREEITYWKISQALQLFERQPIEGISFEENKEEKTYNLASSEEGKTLPYKVEFSEKTVSFRKENAPVPLRLDLVNPDRPNKIEQKDNRIVYYFDNFAEVYTPVQDKLKNDILMLEPPEEGFSLSWQIDSQGGYLEPVLEPDGSIGIYGISKNFEQNEEKDDLTQKVLEALQKEKPEIAEGEKEKILLYSIPAPIVIEASQQEHKDLAFYELNGDILTLQIKGDYSSLSYPISIDPTITYSAEVIFNAGAFLGNNTIVRIDDIHFVISYYGGSGKGLAVVATVSGSSITFGKEYAFTPGHVYSISSSFLDVNRFVLAYADSNDFHIAAVIGTVSGDTISFGSEYEIADIYTFLSISVLDSSRFVVCYKGGDYEGTAVIGTVSGDTITYGSPYMYNDVESGYNRIVVLDSNRFAVVYSAGGVNGHGGSIIGTVSGDTIVFGSEYVFIEDIQWGGGLSAAFLDSSHFVVAYQTSGSSDTFAIIGEVSGSDIVFGSEFQFDGWYNTGLSVAALDSSHFVLVYGDTQGNFPNPYKGTAIIGTVSGMSISKGSEYTFNSTSTSLFSVAALDANNFVAIYSDGGNSGYGTAITGNVSGTAISFGPEYVINSGKVSSVSVTALDDTHFVAVYRDKGRYDYGTAIIGTFSNQNITFGDEYVFNSTSTFSNSVAVLDSSHFVITYEDIGNSNYGTAIIGTVSGTEISFGSEYVFNAGETLDNSLSVWDASHFVIAYTDNANGEYGTAVIGTVSGSAISFGDEYVFNAGATWDPSISFLSNNVFVLTYRDVDNGYCGTAVIGTVSGDTITFGSEYVYNATATVYNSVSALDVSRFVVAYKDAGNSNYGTAIIGTVSGTDIAFGLEYVFNEAETWNISVAALSDTQFAIAYHDCSPGYGTSIIGESSDNIISYFNETVFNAAPSEYVSISALDNSRFVIAYSDSGILNQGAAVVGTVSPYDEAYLFNDGSTGAVSVAALDDSRFVAAYSDTSNGEYGTAIIGNVSGDNVITFGSEYVFNAAKSLYVSVAALDDSRFVAAYQRSDDGSYGVAVIGTVSGNTISYGLKYIFNPAWTYNISVSVLSNNSFAAVYQDGGNSYYGTAAIGTVSGTDIAFGSEYVFKSSNTRYISSTALDSSRFVVAYQEYPSEYGKSIIGTVSGNTIVYGSEVSFFEGTYGNSIGSNDVAALDENHIVIAFNGWGGGGGRAIIGVISGNVITYGSLYDFNPGTNCYHISVTALDAGHFAVAYVDFANNWYSTSIIGIVSGNNIVYGEKSVFNSASTESISTDSLDPSRFVIAYEDAGDGHRGFAVIGTNYLFSVPTAPALVAPSNGATGISLNPDLQFTCTGETGCAKFSLRLDNNADFSSPVISVDNNSTNGPWGYGSTITYSVSESLNNDTVYYWKARIYDGSVWSYWSSGAWHFTTELANQPPIFTSVSINTGNPNICKVEEGITICKSGQNITFNSLASDPDGDPIKLYICKDSFCDNCGPGATSNCWAYSQISSTNNPSAIYNSAAVPACGSGETGCRYCADSEYWAKVCDSAGACVGFYDTVAEPEEITWIKTFGGSGNDVSRSIRQTSDGGYVLAGYTNSSGAGGYDFLVIKIDSSGNVSWSKTFGGPGSDSIRFAQQTSDGGYVLAGETSSYGAGGSDSFIIKLDSSGNVSWSKTFGGPGSDGIFSAQQTSDGGYVLTGITDSYGVGGYGINNIFITKLDSSGNVSWSKIIEISGIDFAYSAQQTSDGGYVLAGKSAFDGFLVIKLDSSGNVSWSKFFNGDGMTYSIRQTSDGGYVLAGYTDDYGAGDSDLIVIKLDSSGNVSWSKIIGGPGSDNVFSAQQTSDGGYVLAGETSSYGAGGSDSFIIKLDSSGNVSWSKTFGGPGSEAISSIQQTSDGGYIAAGYTNSYGAGGYDSFIIKLDSSGNASGCSLLQNASFSLSSVSVSTSSASPSISSVSVSTSSASPSISSLSLNQTIFCPE